MVPLPRLFGKKSTIVAETGPGAKPAAVVVTPDLLGAARSLFRIPEPPDADEAISPCQEAADANPNLARALLRLGIVLYESGRPDAAIQALTKVTRFGKDAGLTNQHCALAYAALGCSSFASDDNHFSEGVAAFQQALGYLASTVDFAPTTLKYAISLHHNGSSDIALEALDGMGGRGSVDELFGTDRPLASCLLACCTVETSGPSVPVLEALNETYTLLRKDFSMAVPDRTMHVESIHASR
jgi:tetratricopeptide (TPR) repeat protein